MAPLATGLLPFGDGTYGFVPDLLKFLLAGKILLCFLYSARLNLGLWLSEKVLDLFHLLLRFSCLSCPCSSQSIALCKVVSNVLGM